MDKGADIEKAGPVPRILGTSRFLIVLAVIGTFIAAATLMVFGVLRTLDIVVRLIADHDVSETGAKQLIVEAVSVIDIFLLGTVLYIISAGLYQLFVDDRLKLPGWLHIGTLDDLKAKLTGVIVVGMLVAFLGYVIEWDDHSTEIIAVGLAIAAVIAAVGLYYRLTGTGALSATSHQRPGQREPSSDRAHEDTSSPEPIHRERSPSGGDQ